MIKRQTSTVQMAEGRIETPVREIWVGYTKWGRSYLDKLNLKSDAEGQIRALRKYHIQKFTRRDRFILEWFLFQSPIVLVAILCATDSGYLEEQSYPCEVQFVNLEKSHELTGGFLRPETLRENKKFFHKSGSPFQVQSSGTRQVLCIGYTLTKSHLVWPLALSCCLAAITTTITAVITNNKGFGAQIGGIVGAATGLLWTYLLWLLK